MLLATLAGLGSIDVRLWYIVHPYRWGVLLEGDNLRVHGAKFFSKSDNINGLSEENIDDLLRSNLGEAEAFFFERHPELKAELENAKSLILGISQSPTKKQVKMVKSFLKNELAIDGVVRQEFFQICFLRMKKNKIIPDFYGRSDVSYDLCAFEIKLRLLKSISEKLLQESDAATAATATAREAAEALAAREAATTVAATANTAAPASETKAEEEQQQEKCAICFDSIHEKDNGRPRALSCAHVFHDSCIKKWFRTQDNSLIPQSCPFCRLPIEYDLDQ